MKKISCTTSEMLIAAFIEPENKPLSKLHRLSLFSHFVNCDRCCLTFAWTILDKESNGPLDGPFFDVLFQAARKRPPRAI